jgi:hypothetical protein
VWMCERVVRVANVEGGRMDGLGRRVEGGMEIRRWVAKARGSRPRNWVICIVIVGVVDVEVLYW